MTTQLRAVIARAFDLSEDQIGAVASPETIPEWDSVGHITLVSEVERSFGIRLTTAEILSIRSSEDLEKLLAERGVLPVPTK